MPAADTTVLRSRHHPGEVGRSVLFGASMVKPLGACMIPVMLGALTSMLTAQPVLRFLTIGFPVALAVASAWTVFQLLRRAVEVETSGEAVRIRSAWDVAGGRVPEWLSVLDVRREDPWISIVLGHDARRLRISDWPNSAKLEAVVREAAHAFAGRVQEKLDGR
ncbi:MAG: hypothetical protein JJ896_17855 [Rhodothermales bacterium]|nr:hypothetical protein [Rhodothermales bacterium]MBO6781528.1 hypothetical protein [Rhodothermales bacterium]